MSAEPPPTSNPEFREAFIEAERQLRIDTGRLACALVVVLMPFGVLLDLLVYPRQLVEFLELRLLCSALVGIVWLLHRTKLARLHYPLVGLPIVILPAAFITLMIYRTEGPVSPYYAGLNLILLAVSAVGHWSFVESAIAAVSVVGMYAVAILLYRPPPGLKPELFENSGHLFGNNLYFLCLTGVIVAAGNVVFNRVRAREFALRFELDQNRRKLQENHQKLLELDQAKSHFFANISHELRTPLTLLLAPVESLLQRPGLKNDALTQDLLQTMQANGLRLLRLINDLLDLVRLESGRMEVRRESLDLNQFVPGLLSTVRPVADSKGIQLHAKLDPHLTTAALDRDKLEKILLNLVFNALKFTPADGWVEVRTRHEGAELVFEVEDTGMGIPAHQLPSVFSRFWQADTSSRRKFPGAGIGLALVKELTEIQGGNVHVASVEGQGTTFTVRLPYLEALTAPLNTPVTLPASATQSVAAAHSEEWLVNLYRRAELFPALGHRDPKPAAASGVPTEFTDRPRVLIADDEPDMLRFLRGQLAQSYDIIDAVDGQQAVDRAASCEPDVVLLDMMMPVKDGLQACRDIRQGDSTWDIPVVLLTARADEETKLAALSAGASDFLTKPFSTTELEVRVRNLISSHQLQKQLTLQNRRLEAAIEQLKETEVQLVQAEKLASLGRLSAGIIHEINNPLNFAATSVYSLRRKESLLPDTQRPEYAEILNDIDEGLRRVCGIVSELRAFTHPGGGPVEPVRVAGVTEVALRFLSHELRELIHVDIDVPETLTVEAERNRLLQVFVNLLQNAADALRQKPDPKDPPAIHISGRSTDGTTVLTIRDNGPGIDPAIRDKIFDPFFTTKDVGQGLGLGLSICFRIVREFGGRLEARSEPGRYTEMVMTFPPRNPPA